MENLAKLLNFGPCIRSSLNGSTSCTMASMSTILNFVFLCGGSHWHYASRLTGFTIQDMAATMSSHLNVLITPIQAPKLKWKLLVYLLDVTGPVLAHKLLDGSKKPIAYASHTLTKPKRAYSWLDKKH